MKPCELAAAFARLGEDGKVTNWGLGTAATAGLDTKRRVFDDPDAAWGALVGACPRAGWLQWQSRQTHFTGNLPEPEAGSGALLAAEAVVSEAESLRLDFLDGQWRLIHYLHDPKGVEYLCDETRHLLHGTHDRHLLYRRYWRIDGDQGAVQTFAVLIGID